MHWQLKINNFATSSLAILTTLCVVSDAPAQTPALSNCTTDTCYAAIDTHGNNIDFDSNRADCQGRGGELASIADNAENSAVLIAVEGCPASNAGFPKALIGLNDIQSPGNYVWSDGSSSSYTHWVPGEPTNLDHEIWAEIHGTGGGNTGQWNDTFGTAPGVPKCYVCELGVEWQASSGGTAGAPSNAFAGQGSVCRHLAPNTGEMIPGRVTGSGCAVAKEAPSGNGNATGLWPDGYEVLIDIGGSSTFGWQPWAGSAPSDAVIGGDSSGGGNRYVCRVQGVGIGSTTPSGTCKIRKLPASPVRVRTATSFEILVLNP